MSQAVIIAAKNGYLQEVKDLLCSGHSVKSRDKNNATALYWVSCYGYNSICEELIRFGAEVDAKIKWGSTPLHAACDRGKTDCVRTLLKHGSDIDAQNQRQDTPLHLAAYRGHSDIVYDLVHHGAKTHLLNGKHKTAECEARGQKHDRIVQIIKESQQIHNQSSRFIDEETKVKEVSRSVPVPHELRDYNMGQEPSSPFSWDGILFNRADFPLKPVETYSSRLNATRESQSLKLHRFYEPICNNVNVLKARSNLQEPNIEYLLRDSQSMKIHNMQESNSANFLRSNSKTEKTKLDNLENESSGLSNGLTDDVKIDRRNIGSSVNRKSRESLKSVTWNTTCDDSASGDNANMADQEMLKWKVETLDRDLSESKKLCNSLQTELTQAQETVCELEKLNQENSRQLQRERENCDRLLQQLELASSQMARRLNPGQMLGHLSDITPGVSQGSPLATADITQLPESCTTVPNLSILHSQSLSLVSVDEVVPDAITHEEIHSCIRCMTQQNIVPFEIFLCQAHVYRRSLQRSVVGVAKPALDDPGREWRYGVDYQVCGVVEDTSQQQCFSFNILRHERASILQMYQQRTDTTHALPPHPNVAPVLHHFTSPSQPFHPILISHNRRNLLPTLPPRPLFLVRPHYPHSLADLPSLPLFASSPRGSRDYYLTQLLYQLLSAIVHILPHGHVFSPLTIRLTDDLRPVLDLHSVSQDPVNSAAPHSLRVTENNLGSAQAAPEDIQSCVHELGHMIHKLVKDHTSNATLLNVIQCMTGAISSQSLRQLMLRIGLEMFGPKDTMISTKQDCVLYYLARLTKCLCVNANTTRASDVIQTLAQSVAFNDRRLEAHFFSQFSHDEYHDALKTGAR